MISYAFASVYGFPPDRRRVTVVISRTDAPFDSLGSSPTDALLVAVTSHQHECRVHFCRSLETTIYEAIPYTAHRASSSTQQYDGIQGERSHLLSKRLRPHEYVPYSNNCAVFKQLEGVWTTTKPHDAEHRRCGARQLREARTVRRAATRNESLEALGNIRSGLLQYTTQMTPLRMVTVRLGCGPCGLSWRARARLSTSSLGALVSSRGRIECPQ